MAATENYAVWNLLDVFGGNKKTGCPTNGRSVGAEKLAAGDPKATKEAQKAPKFKY